MVILYLRTGVHTCESGLLDYSHMHSCTHRITAMSSNHLLPEPSSAHSSSPISLHPRVLTQTPELLVCTFMHG